MRTKLSHYCSYQLIFQSNFSLYQLVALTR